jgi:hypothetical protein
MSTILAITAPSGQTTMLFTGVFSILTFGGGVATLNVMLLSRTIGFFPSLCALGYCLFPLSIASLISLVFSWVLVKVVVIPAAWWWSITSLARFFGPQIPGDRKMLGLYPCALLYAILAWIIFLH